MCDDTRLTQPEAPLQGTLKFLVAVHRDGDAYDARRERTPQVLADRRAVHTEPLCDLALLQAFCVV